MTTATATAATFSTITEREAFQARIIREVAERGARTPLRVAINMGITKLAGIQLVDATMQGLAEDGRLVHRGRKLGWTVVR